MTHIFADLPEAVTNTVELSSRLEFSMEKLAALDIQTDTRSFH